MDHNLGRIKFLARGVLLFALGMIFPVLLDLLQGKKGSIFDSDQAILGVISPNVWIPASCGTAAVILGLLYPCVDYKLGQIDVYDREWASVIRCVALFVGINHATAKIDFTSQSQLSFSLAAMSIGLWWFFDRSRSGLGLAVAMALFATITCRTLASIGYYRLSDPAMSAWLPCVFFSGGVTVGLVGRQLAKSDILESMKRKVE